MIVISADDAKGIRAWDLRGDDAGNNSRSLKILEGSAPQQGIIRVLAISSDARTLVSIDDATIRVWNVEVWECHTTIASQSIAKNGVWTVAVSADCKYLVSGSTARQEDGGFLSVWDLTAQYCVRTFWGEASTPVSKVAISADCKTVVALGFFLDNTAYVWDIETGSCRRKLANFARGGVNLALTPCGKLLSSCDKSICLWNLGTGKCVKTFVGHNGPINSMAISSNGKYMVSGSFDLTIRVWDLESGACQKTLQAYESGLCSLSISPDGSRVISSALNGAIRAWDVPTTLCLRTIFTGTRGTCHLALVSWSQLPQQEVFRTAAGPTSSGGNKEEDTHRLAEAEERRKARMLYWSLLKDGTLHRNAGGGAGYEPLLTTTKEVLEKIEVAVLVPSLSKTLEQMTLLERKLDSNAAALLKLDRQVARLSAVSRNSPRAHEVLQERNDRRNELLNSLQEQLDMLQSKKELNMGRQQIKKKVKSMILSSSPIAEGLLLPEHEASKKEADPTVRDLDEDIVEPFNRLLVNLVKSIVPKIETLTALSEEINAWQERQPKLQELSWYSLLLSLPPDDLLNMSETVVRHERLNKELTEETTSYRTSLELTHAAIKAYLLKLREAVEAEDFLCDQGQLDAEIMEVQTSIQHWKDIIALGNSAVQAKTEKRELDVQIKAARHALKRLTVEKDIAEDNDEDGLAKRLQSLELERKTELNGLYDRVAPLLEVLSDKRLVEYFPELLIEDKSPVHASSAINGASKIIDMHVRIKDYEAVEGFPLHHSASHTNVQIMKDPDGQLCVVKKLVGRKEFRKEAERLHLLRHPLIVPLQRIFLDDKDPESICYIQMPFFSKGNVRPWVLRMQDHTRRFGKFQEGVEWLEVQNTFRQLVQALAHIHAKGIVHRDLKPENILLADSGRIALCDFGISSDVGHVFSATTTMRGAMTLGYGAPEVFTGGWRDHPFAVDMWSLGCMMLELLLPLLRTRLPHMFRDAVMLAVVDPESINWHSLADSFEDVHMKAYVRVSSQLLHLKPEERPTAQELLQDDLFTQVYSKYDPLAKINSIMRNLSKCRRKGSPTIRVTIGNAHHPEEANHDDEVLCRSLLKVFSSLKDVHSAIEVVASDGVRRPLAEVMERFFNQIVLPKYGLFTQRLSPGDASEKEPAEEEIGAARADHAYLPAPTTGNPDDFYAVGLMMAKCLLKGIRMPIVLNTSSLDYLLGHTQQPTSIDLCLAYLSETDKDETSLYRNILRGRQNAIEYAYSVGALTGSESEQYLTDDNKTSVIREAIWNKLVRSRAASLQKLREGFGKLEMAAELQLVTGKELHFLFYGTDFLDLSELRSSLHFIEDTWPDKKVMKKLQAWLKEWLFYVSDLTLRLLAFRSFGHLVTQWSPERHRISIVPSADEQVHFVAEAQVIQLPATCACYEALDIKLRDELFIGEGGLKSSFERRAQVSQEEIAKVVAAMRSEIRAGGWFRCPNGHLYAVGNCGAPVERTKCPECQANIGGQSHRAEAGNVHANVDGSTAPAHPQ